ncbi:flagellar hook-length control protein FliK [Rheinheimera sp.]|uniref:flagellar hook-length control protein FliK n=1 Tax=Rheinheimera sp. TaxID=1869214 RepID=UPI00307D7AB9
MNQINLDSLFQPQARSAQTLVTLVQEQSYQALLSVGKSQGSLTVQSPSGPLTLSSSALNLPQLQGQVTVQFNPTPSGQLQLQLSQQFASPQAIQLNQAQWQQLVSSLSQQLPQTAVSLQVQFRSQDMALLLKLPAQHTPVRLPLPAVLQPLQAVFAQQPASQWLNARLEFNQGELKLQVQPEAKWLASQTEEIQTSLSQLASKAVRLTPSPAVQVQLLPALSQKLNQQLGHTAVPLLQLQQLALPTALKQQLAAPAYQLQLSSTGQLQLKAPLQQQTVIIESPGKSVQLQPVHTEQTTAQRPSNARPAPLAAQAIPAAEPFAGATKHQPQQAEALVPGKVLQPERPQSQAAPSRLSAMNQHGAVQAEPVPLKLEASTVNQAWRQLLPLLPEQWQELPDSPDLPPVVRELLQQVRQWQPDPLKPQLAKELPEQLQALLQFSPAMALPGTAAPTTAASGLALALQLLLGRISSGSQEKTPVKEGKLKELVQQLDSQQSLDLLKKLSSHSASVQQAQLATVEQQAKEPLQQLYFALPLNGQHQSDLCQIVITEREPDPEQRQAGGSGWQLTMKFDLKILGNLLVISQLAGPNLNLQLYTDNNTALLLAEKFLPLLRDRLKAQGLQLGETRCQLGKIPDSLMPKTTSLLAIRV